MLVEIISRFDANRLYLSACVSGTEESGYDVTGLISPINKVKKYYEDILTGDFDFSSITNRGQQLFYGSPGRRARNFLLAASQESAHSGRETKFKPKSFILQGWFADSTLADTLFERNSQTILQIAHIISNDPEAIFDFAAWTYFLIQKNISNGSINTDSAGALIQAFVTDESPFSESILLALNDLDPTFIGLWASDESYQAIRRRSAKKSRSLRLISSFAPSNEIRAVRTSRQKEKLKLAARGASQKSVIVTPEVWLTIENALAQVGPSPTPSFLPSLGSPQKVAYEILKYFGHSLPDLEELASALGTQIVPAELPEEILGLFITNTYAHHSAVLINRSTRTEGSQRFTICHEIGHYLLHNNNAFLCGYKEVYEHKELAEAEANMFAAELMMPTATIRPMTSGRFSMSAIREISRCCTCSLEAAARRFIDIAENRRLAIIVVKEQKVISTGASKINNEGMRWIGKSSTGFEAASLHEAIKTHARGDTRLESYLPNSTAFWLQDLEIDLVPFLEIDGYYLLIEKN